MAFLLALLFLTLIYLIPTLVAFARGHPNRWLILIINLTLGGTGLGWLGSLVWACHALHRPPSGSAGGVSGLNLFIDDVQKVVTVDYDPLPIEGLGRLKTLLDQGAIDADEYRVLKRRLLGASIDMRQLPH